MLAAVPSPSADWTRFPVRGVPSGPARNLLRALRHEKWTSDNSPSSQLSPPAHPDPPTWYFRLLHRRVRPGPALRTSWTPGLAVHGPRLGFLQALPATLQKPYPGGRRGGRGLYLAGLARVYGSWTPVSRSPGSRLQASPAPSIGGEGNVI